jgi:hypothetical protein
MAFFDFITDLFLDDGPDPLKKSGAFAKVDEIGGAFSDELLKLLGPTGESQAFKSGSKLIRDQLGGASAAARQRLGDRGASGGFSDSGFINEGLSDIDRAEFSATSSALEKLILGIEDQKFSTVLPFLSGAANESLGVGTLNANSALTERGQTAGFLSNIAGIRFGGE